MPVIGDDAEIIDAVRVVGMVVGVEHAVEQADAGVEQLIAAVRRRVDQHVRRPLSALALHEQRAAPPPVLRIGGSQAPQTLPMRGTPPDVPQPRIVTFKLMRRFAARSRRGRGTFLNRRKKFSLVVRAMSASLTPRKRGKPRGGVGDEGRLVGLAPHRLGREIRRVGLDQQPVIGHGERDIAQGFGVLEGDDAGERDIAAERKSACAQARHRW